jgi:hypothetical protein
VGEDPPTAVGHDLSCLWQPRHSAPGGRACQLEDPAQLAAQSRPVFSALPRCNPAGPNSVSEETNTDPYRSTVTNDRPQSLPSPTKCHDTHPGLVHRGHTAQPAKKSCHSLLVEVLTKIVTARTMHSTTTPRSLPHQLSPVRPAVVA